MKSFVVYTLARLAMFAAAYGIIWLIAGHWIGWDPVSALSTALVAMVLSSLIAVEVLRPLRNNLAAHVEARATRAKQAFDARRAAEDDEVDQDDEDDGAHESDGAAVQQTDGRIGKPRR
ncbi:MAG: DUF4229 domain-containing protein [Nocardioidaceae bacterium]